MSPMTVQVGVRTDGVVTRRYGVSFAPRLHADAGHSRPDDRDDEQRAAHKGRNEVVQVLVDHGARLDVRDHGSRDTVNGELLGHGWLPLDHYGGLRRVRGAASLAP